LDRVKKPTIWSGLPTVRQNNEASVTEYDKEQNTPKQETTNAKTKKQRRKKICAGRHGKA